MKTIWLVEVTYDVPLTGKIKEVELHANAESVLIRQEKLQQHPEVDNIRVQSYPVQDLTSVVKAAKVEG